MKMNRQTISLILMIISLLLGSLLVGCDAYQNAAFDNEIHDETGIHTFEARNPQGDGQGHGLTISSAFTNLTSEQFPHTQAIPIQHARFVYIIDQHGLHNWREQINLPDFAMPQPGAGAPAPEQPQWQPEAPAQQPQQPATPEEPQAPAVEQPQQQPAEPPQQQTGLSDFEAQVVQITNAERRRHGLADLQVDAGLSHVAREKSNDMQANNYFSHTSPTYGSPFDMMRDFGVSYSAAAENIAFGQQSPEQVVEAWMNSEGHRQNILNGNFTHIGVGYNSNGHYWTQMFIRR